MARRLSAWQLHVKKVMKANPKLSFKQALRKAKQTYKKSSVGVRRKRRRKSTHNPKRRRNIRRMARRRRRGRRKISIPLAVVGGLTAGLADPIAEGLIKGNFKYFIDAITENYTGYSNVDQKWYPDRMIRGLAPLIAGVLVHKFVGGSPLNLNRTLANAGVPLIRI